MFEPTDRDYAIWRHSYPDVNIQMELGFMRDWLAAHPHRRGTRRFVVNWLKRQERQEVARRTEARVGQADFGNVHIRPEKLAQIRERERQRQRH